QRILSAIRVFPVAMKVCNRLLAVAHSGQETQAIELAKGHFQQKSVVLGIIRQEYEIFLFVSASHGYERYTMYRLHRLWGMGSSPTGHSKLSGFFTVRLLALRAL